MPALVFATAYEFVEEIPPPFITTLPVALSLFTACSDTDEITVPVSVPEISIAGVVVPVPFKLYIDTPDVCIFPDVIIVLAFALLFIIPLS